METRMEYARKMALKLREWDAAIDALRLHAELADDLRRKAEYNRKMTALKEKRKDGAEFLRRVHETDEAHIEDVRDAFGGIVGSRRPNLKLAA